MNTARLGPESEEQEITKHRSEGTALLIEGTAYAKE